METVVYLIRHSEVTPKSNIKNISMNDDKQVVNEKAFLSVSGEKKAEAMSKMEELQKIDAVYSSNYARALQTAKYIAQENNTIINIDDRLNERKIGDMTGVDGKDFHRMQVKDFDYKLPGGESLNETKRRITDAMKNILMFETGNRVAVVGHSTAFTCLLSAWCETGRNYDDEIILSYDEETIVDGHWSAPQVFKVTFDGMNVTDIKYIEIN
ncbi:MAG: histidine phosphatase family protein [Bacilli bacterium]|nr:histidine phosphatase family protein [Bacilli bacterium]